MKTFVQKSEPILVKGDLFDSIKLLTRAGNMGHSIIVPHVCNNNGAFGAGFSGAVATYYPIVKENYHLLNFSKHNLGYVQFVQVYRNKEHNHKLIFANMIAQNGIISNSNPRPLNYLALIKAMVRIQQFASSNFDKDNRVQIHAPKFGSGLAGGNWKFIEQLIEDTWTNITTVIYQK